MATVNEKMTAIADAIRDKTEGTEPLTLDDMANQITEVYESGRKQALLEAWGGIQQKGARTEYQNYFKENYWNDTTFTPQYDLNIANGYYMFGRCAVTDLCAILERNGVVLDTSGMTAVNGFQYMFLSAYTATIPDIVVPTTIIQMYQTFEYSNAVTIKSLTVHEALGYMKNNTFGNCTKLENITIKGTIGQNDFDVHWSVKLTRESLLSIINALKDYSADTSGTQWVVTIGTENIAKLTNEELAIATQKGWTLA